MSSDEINSFKKIYITVKAPSHVCTENKVQWGYVKRPIQHKAKLSAVFASRHTYPPPPPPPPPPPRVLYFSYTQARQCFNCYIVLLGCLARSNFSRTQTAEIFGDKHCLKYLSLLQWYIPSIWNS